MNIRGGHMVTLNPIGSIIWRQFSDSRPPDQIAAHLASEFGISREQASADVNEFLEQLGAQHLIESSQSSGLHVGKFEQVRDRLARGPSRGLILAAEK